MDDIYKYRSSQYEPYQRLSGRPKIGAFGIVHKALRKDSTNQLIALKEIKIKSQEHRWQVAREIDLLSRCDHPNILELIEAYQIDVDEYHNVICLATAPYAELSFQEVLEKLVDSKLEPISPWYHEGDLYPWPSVMSGCLSGLDYLHTRTPPIRHRDLKPDNILLRYDPELESLTPIIIDFGISKELLNSRWTTVSGTEQYKAPEQMPDDGSKYGEKVLTVATDIFSLGCCFAQIEAIILGRETLLAVDRVLGLWRDSIAEVNDVIDHAFPIEILSDTNFFSTCIRCIVKNMTDLDPGRRPSAKYIQSSIANILQVWQEQLCEYQQREHKSKHNKDRTHKAKQSDKEKHTQRRPHTSKKQEVKQPTRHRMPEHARAEAEQGLGQSASDSLDWAPHSRLTPQIEDDSVGLEKLSLQMWFNSPQPVPLY